jgi:hypothetical protein
MNSNECRHKITGGRKRRRAKSFRPNKRAHGGNGRRATINEKHMNAVATIVAERNKITGSAKQNHFKSNNNQTNRRLQRTRHDGQKTTDLHVEKSVKMV